LTVEIEHNSILQVEVSRTFALLSCVDILLTNKLTNLVNGLNMS